MGYSLFLLSFNGTSIRDFITRQTYVVIMRFWRNMGYVAFVANQVLSRIRAFLDLFCPDFYSDIEHFTQILCRYMPKKLAAKTSVPDVGLFSASVNRILQCRLGEDCYCQHCEVQ